MTSRDSQEAAAAATAAGGSRRRLLVAFLATAGISSLSTLGQLSCKGRFGPSLGDYCLSQETNSWLPEVNSWLPETSRNWFPTSSILQQHEQQRKLIPKILRGQVPWPYNDDDSHNTTTIDFLPGTLDMSRVETFRSCHVDLATYKHHLQFPRPFIRFPISHPHKLMYFLLPKSGSSTSRWIMEHSFNATDEKTTYDDILKATDYEKISLVREPLNRFFSSYDEFFLRTSPWFNEAHPDPIPKYLHEGLSNYRDYQNVFCPPHTRVKEHECYHRQSQENGTLAARLERWVSEYDGVKPPDVHLHLQTPMLMMRLYTNNNKLTIRHLPLDGLYDTLNATEEWDRLARSRKLQLPDKGKYQGRSYPKRFRMDLISNATKRRVCQWSALDYCCLNFELPEVCRDQVMCVVDKNLANDHDGGDGDDGGGVPKIRPKVYPTELFSAEKSRRA